MHAARPLGELSIYSVEDGGKAHAQVTGNTGDCLILDDQRRVSPLLPIFGDWPVTECLNATSFAWQQEEKPTGISCNQHHFPQRVRDRDVIIGFGAQV